MSKGPAGSSVGPLLYVFYEPHFSPSRSCFPDSVSNEKQPQRSVHIPLLPVLSDIEPLYFLVLGDPQAHRQVKHLEQRHAYCE